VSQYELTNGFRFVIVVVSGFILTTGGAEAVYPSSYPVVRYRFKE